MSVATYLFPSWQELAGKIAHPHSNLEETPADLWPNRVRYPAVKIRRIGKGIQNVLVAGNINISRERGLQDQPEGLEGGLESNPFAFVISVAAIADRRLVNASLPFRQFQCDPGFESETLAPEWNTLQERGAKGFVAGFHIREIEIGEYITRSRQEMFRKRVPKKSGAGGGA